ncbi:hypothetical protein HPP92_006224 [Vanilla planifolia]|uniref:Uncharacterized protein n=1 Tax=Vanilla planifolia TaxID=51239 RepID=A0A835RMV4_VANPL|nr:hypothetical protein HPP92_006224 [Vanilla planifolia]
MMEKKRTIVKYIDEFVPAGRGLVMGWLRFVESGRTISCIKSPNTAYSIPACVEEVEVIESVAQYILVVEKETVLQRLANDNFAKQTSAF